MPLNTLKVFIIWILNLLTVNDSLTEKSNREAHTVFSTS